MAWIDDRIWCHPKIASVAKPTKWVYVAAVAYSSGFSTGGELDRGQQQTIGATLADRKALVQAGLWDDLGHGRIRIHDWDDHNGKRDERKARERERQRALRARNRTQDRTQYATQDSTQYAGVLKEVKEVKEEPIARDQPALQALDPQALTSYDATQAGHEDHDPIVTRLIAAAGGGPDATTKIARTVKAHRCSERDIACAIEAATGPGVNDPLAVALTELVKRAQERAA